VSGWSRYDIVPVPLPRLSRRDTFPPFRPAASRFYSFRDQVQYSRLEIPPAGAHVLFDLPVPKSWSERRKSEMIGSPHERVPDLDNMLKALLDSVFFGSTDAHVSDIRITKRWSRSGGIYVREIDPPELPDVE